MKLTDKLRNCGKIAAVGAILAAGSITAASAQAKSGSAGSAQKPNIIVIMTDDVGVGDLGCYGGGILRGAPTPNLDRMAAEGMRFANYYGQASCTAGRASFITGRVPIRTSLSSVLAPGDPNGLKKETPTIAQAMKKQGYKTVQFGKWHLGDKEENFPTSVGFDEMYHMTPYYAGVYAYEDPTLHPNFPRNDPEFMKEWKALAVLSEFEGKAGQKAVVTTEDFNYQNLKTGDDNMRADAVEWIKKNSKGGEPFFMYLNFLKVHNPNNPSDRWKGKSPGGMPYQDALMELDDNSGQILQAIRDLGIEENTLIVWTTDNGAWVDAWPDAGYTPFRGMKGTPFEGGFRCPAIAWWPGHIQAGSVSNEMMCHMDWWPTFVKITGGTPPPYKWVDNVGKKIIFDGIDNSDMLLGKGPSKRDFFAYFNDQYFGAIRYDNLKMVFTAKDTWLGPELPLNPPAIYDLWQDPGENYDLIFNGAAPTRGDLKTSPGRYSGQDNAWMAIKMNPKLISFLTEFKDYPNIPYQPWGMGLTKVIPADFK